MDVLKHLDRAKSQLKYLKDKSMEFLQLTSESCDGSTEDIGNMEDMFIKTEADIDIYAKKLDDLYFDQG